MEEGTIEEAVRRVMEGEEGWEMDGEGPSVLIGRRSGKEAPVIAGD